LVTVSLPGGEVSMNQYDRPPWDPVESYPNTPCTFRWLIIVNTVEPGYNDIGLYDTSPIASDILWYQLIPRC
jgi:hypothetical protein